VNSVILVTHSILAYLLLRSEQISAALSTPTPDPSLCTLETTQNFRQHSQLQWGRGGKWVTKRQKEKDRNLVVVTGPYLPASTRKAVRYQLMQWAYLIAIYKFIYTLHIKFLSLAGAWWRHSPYKLTSLCRRSRRLCRSRLCRWVHTELLNTPEVNTLPPPMLPTWSEFSYRTLSLVGSACTVRQLTAVLVVNHPVWHLLLHDGQKLYPYMCRAASYNYRGPS
jgi:hypothetical protein